NGAFCNASSVAKYVKGKKRNVWQILSTETPEYFFSSDVGSACQFDKMQLATEDVSCTTVVPRHLLEFDILELFNAFEIELILITILLLMSCFLISLHTEGIKVALRLLYFFITSFYSGVSVPRIRTRTLLGLLVVWIIG